jgi:hypothetical protein
LASAADELFDRDDGDDCHYFDTSHAATGWPKPFGDCIMLNYTGTPETVHFVNWALHSGCVDPFALADKAVKAVDMEGEDAAQKMREVLANLLEKELAKQAGKFAPGFTRGDDLEYATCQYSEDNYGRNPNCLFGPLFTSAIQRIDLWQAANLIFVHIGRAA